MTTRLASRIPVLSALVFLLFTVLPTYAASDPSEKMKKADEDSRKTTPPRVAPSLNGLPDGAVDLNLPGNTGPAPPRFYVPKPLGGSVTPNVLVNDRQLCPNGLGLQQNETSIVVAGEVVIAAYNDARGGPGACQDERAAVGWAFSLDGGATFTDGGVLPFPRNLNNGDPWLGASPDGQTFYLSGLWNSYQGFGFYRGYRKDDAIVWTDPVIISQGGSMDKEAFVVDQNSGYIYLTYTRLSSGIWLTRSYDGGDTWLAPVNVAPGGTPQPQGSFPVVNNQGVLYVAYNRGYPSPLQQTAVGRSTDGGASFERMVTFDFRTGPVIGLDRTPAFPQLAVDNSGGPRDGWLYLVWHELRNDEVHRPMMSHSEDGGTTWSEPVFINNEDNSGHRWFPTVSVDDNGYVNVVFYDRRHNPDTTYTDVWFSQSTDGGYTFAERQVSDVTGEWAGILYDRFFIYGGDYIRAISYGTDVYAVWTDPRNGDPDIYFARIDAAAVASARQK